VVCSWQAVEGQRFGDVGFDPIDQLRVLGFKVDLDNQPLTMTTPPLSTPDAFAHKSAHYPTISRDYA